MMKKAAAASEMGAGLRILMRSQIRSVWRGVGGGFGGGRDGNSIKVRVNLNLIFDGLMQSSDKLEVTGLPTR